MSEVLRRHQVYQVEELAFAKSRLDFSLVMARKAKELVRMQVGGLMQACSCLVAFVFLM